VEASDIVLRSLRRRWPLIVVTVLVAVAAAFLFVDQQPTEHRAEARLLVGPPDDAPVDTLRAAGLVAHTYAELAVARSTLVDAAEATGMPGDLDDLRERVDADANENTRVVRIVVEATDPEVATAYLTQVTERITSAAPVPTEAFDEELEEIVLLEPAGMVTVIDDPGSAPEPLDRPVALLLLLAGAVAALLAVTAAVALESAPWRRGPANLDALRQRRYLGRLTLPATGPASVLPNRRRRRLADRERRLVATKVQHLTAGRALGSLSILGGEADDGSTLAAAQLATEFAADGRSVIVADLTDSDELSRHLRVGRGQHEVVTVGDAVLELADARVGTDRSVRLLVSEAVRDAQGGPQGRHVVEVLADLADLVIAVVPPVLTEYGSLVTASRTDGAIVVAADEVTSVERAGEAFDLLRAHDVRVIGTLLATTSVSEHGRTSVAAAPPAPVAPRVADASSGWSSDA
jgi:Mrp family chromosome partitioning ATPase/capsular polysaccharide biosynthesis protein